LRIVAEAAEKTANKQSSMHKRRPHRWWEVIESALLSTKMVSGTEVGEDRTQMGP
jgi:hypothetical protein